jgi:hypothetical protein
MENPDKIKYKFKFEENYNPKYVNGAYGGMTGKGEFVVHFYLERMGLPLSTSYEVDANGKMSQETMEVKPDDHGSSLVRFIQNGIIMDYNTAKAVHAWLGDQIGRFESILNPVGNE